MEPKTTQNGIVKFKNKDIEVLANYDLRDPKENLQIGKSHTTKKLNDGIKITVFSKEADFIQFVTRMVPNLYLYNVSKKITWDKVVDYYMEDSVVPRFKLDILEQGAMSCFYNDYGLSSFNENSTSIYDCPGLAFDHERAIFCTFVITRKQITHLIKWSKQLDYDNKASYYVMVETCQNLPIWAKKQIILFYNSIFVNIPEYLVPKTAIQSFLEVPDKICLEEATFFYLKPEEKWITKKEMPQLFNEFEKNF